MTITQEIKQCIEEQLDKGKKKFIIFPFGDIGIQTKNILSEVYDIEAEYILDNHLPQYNSKIKPLSYLKEISCDDYVLVLSIINIEIYNDIREKVLEYKSKGKQVISPETATIMNRLLQGVVYGKEGTGGSIAGYNSMKAYAKTGTSSESNDLWMVAGTPYYVGSVWYGFDLRQTVHSTSAAATIWRDVMRDVHRPLKNKDFTYSENVVMRGSGYYKKGTNPDNLTLYQGETSSVESTESVVSSVESQPVSSNTQSGAAVSSKPPESSGESSVNSSQNSSEQNSSSSDNSYVSSNQSDNSTPGSLGDTETGTDPETPQEQNANIRTE